MHIKPWKKRLRLISKAFFLITLLNIATSTHAQTIKTVNVGVTHFPPFYDVTSNGQVSGLGIDIIRALNHIQSSYHFTPVIASPRRRHAMFKQGRFDMSFFDHLAWGWDMDEVDATQVYLTGGEVFITRKIKGRDQTYFNDIHQRSVAAIRGYHYKFADYQTDPQILKRHFQITLTNSQDHIIKLVEENRVDIGILTETYLLQYFQSNPAAKSKFLSANEYDQLYNFRTIVRKGTSPSALKMDKLMTQLRTHPDYDWLKEKYGIDW